jgi:branched-chain amino acid aminotransferase
LEILLKGNKTMLQNFDPKNQNIIVHVNGRLLPRGEAKVSVFDSSVQGGDAVWEGLRIYNGKIFKLREHLTRLQESAKSLAFTDIPTKGSVINAISKTLAANKMNDGVHIRLTLTRGEKVTSGMDPRLNQSGSCLIVLAEWKPPVYDSKGIKLVTANIRRNSPLTLDSKIHHNNLLNNILAKIEANHAQVDDAIMLDLDGFVSETNATNIFMTKHEVLYTPFADSCLPGITRKTVLEIANKLEIETIIRNLSITEFYNADQVFVTGTMGELTPVYEIDGRKIEDKIKSGILKKINSQFYELIKNEGEKVV